MRNFCQLLFHMRKVYKFFTITAILINTPIWIDHCNNSDTIQFDFNEFLTSNLRLMIRAVVCKLTTKHRNTIFCIFLFHNFINGIFTEAGSHIFDKDTTIPTIPFCFGSTTHHLCYCVASKIACQ